LGKIPGVLTLEGRREEKANTELRGGPNKREICSQLKPMGDMGVFRVKPKYREESPKKKKGKKYR